MILTKLRANDFMPFKGEMSIEFAKDSQRNVTIIVGDNMRGKTSLLNAIRWALYGRAIGRHSQMVKLVNLFNRESVSEGFWNLEVSLSFRHASDEYEITRSATKKDMVADPKNEEDFITKKVLFKNGSPVTPNLIDALINRIAPEQISRFFLFDGELLAEYEQLVIDGSEQSSKIKKAIEEALGVPTLTRGRFDAAAIFGEAQKQQSADLKKIKALEALATKQDTLRTEVDVLKASVETLDTTIEETRCSIEDIEEDLKSYESSSVALGQLSAKEGELRNIDELISKTTKERLEAIKDGWRELLKPLLLSKRTRVREDIQEFQNVSINLNALEHKLQNLSTDLNYERCHACGHDLTSQQLSAAKAELEQIKIQHEKISFDEKTFKDLLIQDQDLDELLQETKAAYIPYLDSDLDNYEVRRSNIEFEISELEEQLEGQDTVEISNKRKDLASYQQRLGALEVDKKNEEKKLEIKNRDLLSIAKQISRNPHAGESSSTEIMKVAGELEKIYEQSIDRLREDLKIRVQNNATIAFKKLTSQQKYTGLKINDNYGLTILDENDSEVKVRSAGAEQIVAMALIDGLAQAAGSCGPLIMDTPFGRLDKIHRTNILKYLPTTTPQLVLLVHDGEFDPDRDLQIINDKVGHVYHIEEISSNHSRIVKDFL